MKAILAAICLGISGVLLSSEAAIVLRENNSRIELYRGGSIVDDPTAVDGTAVQVGRDWSIGWYLMPQSMDSRQSDEPEWYDVTVRCRGTFDLGLYRGGSSTFLTGYHQLVLPAEQWSDIFIGRFQLLPGDYLTADGVAGEAAFMDEVELVPHPLDAGERELLAMEDCPTLTFDGSGTMTSEWLLCAFEPVRWLAYLPQDTFCLAPHVTVRAFWNSGRTAEYHWYGGRNELEIPASPSDRLEKLQFSSSGDGRMILRAVCLNEINDRFLLTDVQLESPSGFDTAAVSAGTYSARDRSRFRLDRMNLFADQEDDAVVAAVPESAMHKIFQYEIGDNWSDEPIGFDIALARNEAEHVQMVLVPRGEKPVELRISFYWDSLPVPEELNWHVDEVGYVVARPKAYRQLRQHVDYYPDPLLPLADGVIRLEDCNIPLWLTVTAGEGTQAGRYAGRFIVEDAEGRRQAEIPVTVRVFDFDLPKKSSFRTCFFLHRPSVIDFFGITDWETEREIDEKIIRLAAENRLTLMPMLEHVPQRITPLWDAYLEADGSYSFDFRRENELTRLIIDELHGSGWNIEPSPTFAQYLGYIEVTERVSGQKIKLNFHQSSPEFAALYRDFLQAAWQNAIENHWEQTAYHYIWDEWKGDAWNQLYCQSKEFVPGLKTMAVGYSLGEMTPETKAAIDIWVPLSPAYQEEFARQQRQLGKEVWAYVCVSPKDRYNLFIDHQAFGHRALCWWLKEHDVDGLLYWGVNYWALAAEERQQGAVWPDIDWQANQFVDANGDGYLMYPDYRTDEIYGSQRLAVLRDGLEDLEYFHLLERLLAEAKNDSDWRYRAEVLQENCKQVTVGEHAAAVDDQSTLLEQCRRSMGELIEERFRLNEPGAN